MLLSGNGQFELAQQLRADKQVEVGEVFSFLSGLYFRGKIAYARHFALPPERFTGHFVITSTNGLIPSETPIGRRELECFAEVPIDSKEPRYANPLRQSAEALQAAIPESCMVVLLGSIASDKYVEILAGVFGERLLFPAEFIGRGDMSRGGLLLRAVSERRELEYYSVLRTENRRGKRPPRLAPVRATVSS